MFSWINIDAGGSHAMRLVILKRLPIERASVYRAIASENILLPDLLAEVSEPGLNCPDSVIC